MEPKQQPPYPLRISPEMRERLEVEAANSKRSLNAEIADRLEKSFLPGGAGIAPAALMHSLAKAEEEAAARSVESAARLLRGATIAHTLMRVINLIGAQDLDEELGDIDLDAAYADAYKLAHEADLLVESGQFDDAMDAAERAQKRRAEALNAMHSQMPVAGLVAERIVSAGQVRKDGSQKLTVEQITRHEVKTRSNRGKNAGEPRVVPVEVKKKRTFIKRGDLPKP